MHFDFWVSTKYERYDVKVQQATINTQAYSSDGQTMDIELVLQYQIQSDKAIDILDEACSKVNIAGHKVPEILLRKTE